MEVPEESLGKLKGQQSMKPSYDFVYSIRLLTMAEGHASFHFQSREGECVGGCEGGGKSQKERISRYFPLMRSAQRLFFVKTSFAVI
jgi:hypothetical protein